MRGRTGRRVGECGGPRGAEEGGWISAEEWPAAGEAAGTHPRPAQPSANAADRLGREPSLADLNPAPLLLQSEALPAAGG